MSNSFPLLRRLAQSLRIYQPLHRFFIRYLLWKQGIKLTIERDALLLSRHDGCRIRVKDWDTAAIASYSFSHMYNAVEPDSVSQIVDYSRPRWHRIKPGGEEYYFTSIADLEVDEFWDQYSSVVVPGSIVFHVGAYCGVQTVEFSRRVGASGRVVAFEPDLESFRALTLNLEKHDCGQVVPINKGLWNCETELTFFATQGMHSSFTNKPSHENQECRLKVTTADLVMERHQISRLDLYKIDAEGAELEILKGSEKLLREFKPLIFIDVHLHSDPQLDQKIDRFLGDRGYVANWLDHYSGTALKFCLATRSK